MQIGGSTAIQLETVSKRYGAKEVLHDVDLDIATGECFALLGHNGAGKTTLIKLMLGLARPSAGRLRVLGVDPSGTDATGLREQTEA